jgi:hypothetical protein
MLRQLERALYFTGSQLLRLKDNRALATGAFATLPTAAASYRGAWARTEGGNGEADTVSFCRKNAADAYQWIDVSDTWQLPVATDTAEWPLLSQAGAGGLGGTSWSAIVGVDLTGYTEVRYMLTVATVDASANTPVTRLQYSLNNSTWATLTSPLSLASTGIRSTAWESIPAAAQAEVLIRPFASGGDDAGSPRAVGVTAFFRR